MSDNNPSITVADIVTDVEARLSEPDISTSVYLPWVNYAYQRTFRALLKCDQRVKEELFGDDVTFNLSTGILEYSLSTNIPRFGGILKVEVKYGASADEWTRAQRLSSIAHWKSLNQVSTTYRSKLQPLYFILQDSIGFIPTPPESGAQAQVWYVKRPYQLTLTTDVIDIPYRFIDPLVNYVQSKAIQKENEDYSTSRDLEQRFMQELEDIAVSAASEYDEHEGTGVEVSTDSALFDNPLRY